VSRSHHIRGSGRVMAHPCRDMYVYRQTTPKLDLKGNTGMTDYIRLNRLSFLSLQAAYLNVKNDNYDGYKKNIEMSFEFLDLAVAALDAEYEVK
jgi:hypothetical protein